MFTKGQKKTGGRAKGQTNKITAKTKDVLAAVLTEYQESGLMAKDFAELEPKERLVLAERMLQYIRPKMQSIAADLTASAENASIRERLARLAGENE